MQVSADSHGFGFWLLHALDIQKNVAGITMTANFTNFLDRIIGGILTFGPTVHQSLERSIMRSF